MQSHSVGGIRGIFGCEYFERITGAPLKPSPRHTTWRLKSSLEGNDEGEADDVNEDKFEVNEALCQGIDEASKIIK